MEIKEYDNPESKDYDLRLRDAVEEEQKAANPFYYEELLIELVGFLEDGAWVEYGLTTEEYMHPTAETIAKVESYMQKKQEKHL